MVHHSQFLSIRVHQSHCLTESITVSSLMDRHCLLLHFSSTLKLWGQSVSVLIYKIFHLEEFCLSSWCSHQGLIYVLVPARKRAHSKHAQLLFKWLLLWVMAAFLLQHWTFWTESWQRRSAGIIVSLLCSKRAHPSGCPTEDVLSAGMKSGSDDEEEHALRLQVHKYFPPLSAETMKLD